MSATGGNKSDERVAHDEHIADSVFEPERCGYCALEAGEDTRREEIVTATSKSPKVA